MNSKSKYIIASVRQHPEVHFCWFRQPNPTNSLKSNINPYNISLSVIYKLAHSQIASFSDAHPLNHFETIENSYCEAHPKTNLQRCFSRDKEFGKSVLFQFLSLFSSVKRNLQKMHSTHKHELSQNDSFSLNIFKTKLFAFSEIPRNRSLPLNFQCEWASRHILAPPQ